MQEIHRSPKGVCMEYFLVLLAFGAGLASGYLLNKIALCGMTLVALSFVGYHCINPLPGMEFVNTVYSVVGAVCYLICMWYIARRFMWKYLDWSPRIFRKNHGNNAPR